MLQLSIGFPHNQRQKLSKHSPPEDYKELSKTLQDESGTDPLQTGGTANGLKARTKLNWQVIELSRVCTESQDFVTFHQQTRHAFLR